MNPYDKKMIIDIVFSLDQLNSLYELCKDDVKKIGDKINANSAELFALNNTMNQAIEELKKNTTVNSLSEELKIKENLKKIEEFTAKKDLLMSNYSEWNTKHVNISSKLIEEHKNLHDIESAANQIEKKIDLFNHDKCPTCGSSFKSSEFENIKQKLKEVQSKLVIQKDTILKKISEFQKIDTKLLEGSKKISDTVSQIQSEITKLVTANSIIKEMIEASSQLTGIQNIIDKTKASIDNVQKEIDADNNQANNLQKLLLIYSADGAKEEIIKTYLPIFNNAIKEHLNALNFPYFISFDSKFNVKVKEYNIEIPIESLSDGEMTRVDLAVICALFKVLKHKFPTINIFHLDEILSTLDSETSNVMLEFLRKFANEERLNIMVVSHVDMDLGMFDSWIMVEKKNGFSEMSN